MGDEVTRVDVASVLVFVDRAGPRLERAVVIDDNLVYREDGECSCYPTSSGYSLFCALEPEESIRSVCWLRGLVRSLKQRGNWMLTL